MRKLGLLSLLAGALFAQKKPITLDTLRDRSAPEPVAANWAPNGKTFAFREDAKLKLYDVAGKASRLLVALDAIDAAAAQPPSTNEPADWTNRRARTGGMQWSSDGKALLYASGGDLFLIHIDSGNWEQLTHTSAVEIDPKLSPDNKRVAFRRGWDLYTLDVESKVETRLTSNGSSTMVNGGLDWVYPEELNLGSAFWWSPDSQSLAYLQFDISREPLVPHEDLLKTHALFEPQRYPQAGENNADVHLGVISASGGPTRWFDVGDTRDTYLIARAGWMPDARRVYVMRSNRVQNRLEMLAFDLETGIASTIFREEDAYWINLRGDVVFLKDRKHFLWTSERDGYRHIYLYANDGKDSRQLTKGDWEVHAIEGVDEAAGKVLYTSSEATHLERQLYAIGLDGRNKRRLTQQPGIHNISMGPGGSYYLDTWSSLTQPPETVLYSGNGNPLGVYRAADHSQMNEYEILPAEIMKFQGADGTPLYGRLIRPAGFEAGKKYPLIVNVYGGPDVALPVRNSWQGVGLDEVLAHKGYAVWQAENRGGSGRGHAFETAIRYKLGVNELADQVAGVQYLISRGIADPQRIGIRGWSYGGFMTVNALLNAPDVFRAGFAGAPVTNWLNYDSIYTERYMGLPKENAEGYTQTALAKHAGNLKGHLMLVHNFEDDNVLFQNTLQLTDALQMAAKQFELMLYPQKTHAVAGAAARQMNQMMLDFFDRSLK